MYVHTHATGESGLLVNAYIIETKNGVVVVDGTLTVSDSTALRSRIDSIGKPLLAVLITHAHPDHVAGITNIVNSAEVPIVALESVERQMRATEAAKHAQWSSVFGNEWISHWTYPNRLLQNGDSLTFDGVRYEVHDLGAGGDSDANAIWIAQDDATSVAFVGDLVFNGTHVYIADGKVLRWLANLERAKRLLKEVKTIYPGHGREGSLQLLDVQRDYLLRYSATVLELVNDASVLDDTGKQELTERLQQLYPGAPLAFMIGLSADAVAAELR